MSRFCLINAVQMEGFSGGGVIAPAFGGRAENRRPCRRPAGRRGRSCHPLPRPLTGHGPAFLPAGRHAGHGSRARWQYRSVTAYRIKLGKSGTRRSPAGDAPCLPSIGSRRPSLRTPTLGSPAASQSPGKIVSFNIIVRNDWLGRRAWWRQRSMLRTGDCLR